MSSEAPPEGNQLLIDEIRRAIERAGGRIPFRDYMELALYHPEHGYYSAPGEKTGKRGDYLTSPQLSPLFGQCLARFIGGGPVVELGAGDGSLAAQLAHGRDYTIVDRSPDFRRRQRQLLGSSVRWLDAVPAGFEGTILSNELLDALPVHRLVGDQERYVTLDLAQGPPAGSEASAMPRRAGKLAGSSRLRQPGTRGSSTARLSEAGSSGARLTAPEASATPRLREDLGPWSTPRLAEYFDRLGLRPAGQAEVNLDAVELMAGVYACLARGRVLTMDYGYEAEELFVGRPQGTFLTYERHTANDNPYEHVGRKDMTAHVDFSTLMALGEAHGLRTIAFTTQADFLVEQGIGDMFVQQQREASDAAAYASARQAAISLLDPRGLGGFRVLIQEKR